jgi:nucleotide-binding universal stress UspA family protein
MRAAKVAIDLAKSRQADLTVLNVVPSDFLLPSPFGSRVLQKHIDDAKAAATKVESAIVELAKSRGVNNVRCIVESSDSSVEESIIKKAEAERTDLIVIGTRGLGGFKKLLLGSVSSGVVTHAHCDVLVVR